MIALGTARSSTWTELGGFGVDPDDTKKTWDEFVRVLPRLWSDEHVSYEGRSFSMPERNVLPKPVQKPHPPMWVTVTSPGTELDAAERYLRLASDRLEAVGEKYLLSTVSGLLGQTLYAAGRFDEVEPLARLSRELATDDDIDTQTLWRCLQGKVLAREGSVEEGEALVRQAIEMLASTDALLFQSDALLDLAEVLRVAGSSEVRGTLEEARALAEAKGSPVVVSHIDRLLASASSSLV